MEQRDQRAPKKASPSFRTHRAAHNRRGRASHGEEEGFADARVWLDDEDNAASPKNLEKVFKVGSQPNLRLALGSHALEAMAAAPKNVKFGTKTQIVSLAMIFTVIELLDAKGR